MGERDYPGREKVHSLLDRAEKVWNRSGAWVIMRGAEHVATIKVAYPADGAGRLRVFVWDFTVDGAGRIQHGSASGGGYDKLSSALDGMTIAGVKLDCNGTGTQWRQLEAAGLTVINAI